MSDSGTAGDANMSSDQLALGQSHSILSDKVSRALQVRTDTPAMKAALEALCHLDTKQHEYSVDSRTVRVAIEQDALQQALSLQRELKSLVLTIQELRQGVSETATIAHKVRESIHMNVITSETENTMLQKPSHHSQGADGVDSNTVSLDVYGKADAQALEQEQKLASVLSDAFSHRDFSRKRLEAVHSFLEKFNLSQEDSRLLDHYAFEDIGEGTTEFAPVNGMAFLNALERVRKIRQALTRTFGASGADALVSDDTAREDQHSNKGGLGASSALRMMESLAQKQERAYERLYHWLQRYLQVFSSSSTSQTSTSFSSVDQDVMDEALQHPFVKQSLHTLRHVPAFYSHVLELVASSRRGEETRRFLLALTSGYAGLPPIEMKAHDVVAYVGDMLAFSFKAFSVEADITCSLLVFEEDIEGTSIALKEESNQDTDMFSVEQPITAKDMLAISMSGLARPLKSRILQVIATLARRPDEQENEAEDGLYGDEFEEEGAMVRTRLSHLYEICGLLLFYISALEKGMLKIGLDTSKGTVHDEKNPIIACILDCFVESASAYGATLRVYGAMLSQLSSITGESEASLTRSMLSSIAELRQHSPGFSVEVSCPADTRKILSIDWATETLVEAALISCTILDDAMSLKLAISIAKSAGMETVAAERLDERVDAIERSLIEKLVDIETSSVLKLCGLSSLWEASSEWREVEGTGRLMATYPGLSQEEAEAGMREFYASLFSPPLPSLETTIKDPVLRKTTRSKIASSVAEVYTTLYESMISSGKGGYDDISFLSHSADQVKTLFSS